MDEVDVNPIGARLRAAREARGLTLDEIAGRTRIPTRHLEAIEQGEWDSLPAATYTVGFARSYANVVGLDGSQVAAELRAVLNERQGILPAQSYYEPADPARVPPKLLVITAVVIAVLLAGGYAIWRNIAFGGSDEPQVVSTDLPAASAPAAAPAAAAPAPAPAASASGPVVLTATDDAWLRIYEAGGKRIYEGTLHAGERYEVPAAAQAPLILTGRPDAVKVTVGTTEIPPLGPPQRTIADVSLAPRDLLARLQPAAPASAPAAPPAAPPSGTAPPPPAGR